MKQCFKCGTNKPEADFYRHPMMADGRLGKCKECTKIDVRERRRAAAFQYALYERARFHDPKRKEQIKLRQRKARLTNPDKTRARAAISRALRSGRIKRKPCEVCGRIVSEAHHTDYTKPLDVRWLCRAHHKEAHGLTPILSLLP